MNFISGSFKAVWTGERHYVNSDVSDYCGDITQTKVAESKTKSLDMRQNFISKWITQSNKPWPIMK